MNFLKKYPKLLQILTCFNRRFEIRFSEEFLILIQIWIRTILQADFALLFQFSRVFVQNQDSET